jgi:DNA-binding HxlR family transcriptional regulator
MGLSVAIASLALIQSGPAVSYAADAVTVGELVKALAKEAKVNLDVAPAVAGEPVVVQFKDRPLDEVQARLANLIGAAWIDNGGVPTLTRPASLRTDQEREERRRMADWLTRMLDLRLREFEKVGAFDRAQADLLVDRYRLAEMKVETFTTELARINADNPVVRATTGVLRTVDPIRLIQMRIGQRIVFSDSPTSVQSPLTTKGKALLDATRKDITVMEAASKALGNPRKPFMNIVGHPIAGPGTTRDPYGKTVLAITRYGALDFRFELTQVTKDGRRLLNGQGALPDLGSQLVFNLPKKGHPLEVSEEALALGKLEVRGGGVNYGGSRRIEMEDGKVITASFWVPFEEANDDDPAARVRPKLIDPVRYDPLGIVLGPLLRQAATRRNASLMATLGDDGLRLLARMMGGEGISTEEALWAALTRSTVDEKDRIPLATIKESPEWIEIRPFFPVYARTARFDRRAVRDLIGEVRREGALTLAMAARYGRPLRRSSLEYLYIINGDPAVGPTEVGGVFNAATEFFLDLTPGQGNRLREEPLPVGDLSVEQRERVRRWVYEDLLRFYRDHAERTSRNALAVDHMPLIYEPTELFPNGVPPSLRLSIEQKETPVVLTQSTQGLRFALDAPSLGLLEGMQAQPGKHPEAARRSLVYYRPARWLSYRLKLLFDPKNELTLGVTETRPNSGSRFGPRSALPEAVLKEAEAVREAFLKGEG